MRCDDLQGLLTGLVAGDLTPAQEEFVRLHLQGCARCQTAFAGLLQTRRQLSLLADERYQPQLGPRVSRAMERHRARRAVIAWSARSLRAAGVLAAVALVFGLLLWQQGPDLRSAGPAAPPAYMVVGRELMELDLTNRSSRAVKLSHGYGTLHPGGLVIAGPGVYRLDPPDLLEPEVVPLDPLKLGPGMISYANFPSALTIRDGPVAWTVKSTSRPRQTGTGLPTMESGFRLDRINLETGEVEEDPVWKAGHGLAAALSPDGRHLYLLARLDGDTGLFVKVINTRTRELVDAHRPTAGFGPLSRLLISTDGDRLFLIDQGRLLSIDLKRGAVLLDREEPELTAQAALSPDATQLVTARPDGGLALWDAATGEPLRLIEGRRYRSLTWQGDWIYAAHDAGLDLVSPTSLRMTSSMEMELEGDPLIYVP